MTNRERAERLYTSLSQCSNCGESEVTVEGYKADLAAITSALDEAEKRAEGPPEEKAGVFREAWPFMPKPFPPPPTPPPNLPRRRADERGKGFSEA